MKRFASLILIFILVLSMFVGTAVTVFATDEQAPHPELETKMTWDDFVLAIDNINYTDLSTVTNVYNVFIAMLKGYYNDLVTFIESNETYSDIATAILGILAFITFPIVVGIIIVIYIAIGAMILFAGALTAVVELVLGIVSSFVPF